MLKKINLFGITAVYIILGFIASPVIFFEFLNFFNGTNLEISVHNIMGFYGTIICSAIVMSIVNYILKVLYKFCATYFTK